MIKFSKLFNEFYNSEKAGGLLVDFTFFLLSFKTFTRNFLNAKIVFHFIFQCNLLNM